MCKSSLIISNYQSQLFICSNKISQYITDNLPNLSVSKWLGNSALGLAVFFELCLLLCIVQVLLYFFKFVLVVLYIFLLFVVVLHFGLKMTDVIIVFFPYISYFLFKVIVCFFHCRVMF
jgi:hypothetical protein